MLTICDFLSEIFHVCALRVVCVLELLTVCDFPSEIVHVCVFRLVQVRTAKYVHFAAVATTHVHTSHPN